MYEKKRLKKENNIINENIIIWVFSLIIIDKSLTGKKPPDEIIVKAKFNESNVLIEKIFKITIRETTMPKKIKKLFFFSKPKKLKNCFKKPKFKLKQLYRGVAQSGRASGLGPEGREFESLRPDHFKWHHSVISMKFNNLFFSIILSL